MAFPVSPEEHVAAIPGVTSAVVDDGRMLVTVDSGLDATTVALRAAIVLNALGAGLPVEVTGGRRTPSPAPLPSAARWAGLSMTNAARVACAAVLAGSAGLAAISNISAPLGSTPAFLAVPPLHHRARPSPPIAPPAGAHPPVLTPPGAAPPSEGIATVADAPSASVVRTVHLMVALRPVPAVAKVTPKPTSTVTPAVPPAVPPAATAPLPPRPTTALPTPPHAPISINPPVSTKVTQVVVASSQPPVVTLSSGKPAHSGKSADSEGHDGRTASSTGKGDRPESDHPETDHRQADHTRDHAESDHERADHAQADHAQGGHAQAGHAQAGNARGDS